MNKGLLCIALHGHAIEVFGPIVILRDDARRITFMCPRCETIRQDVWSTKGMLLTRGYKHGTEYAAWLRTHERSSRTMTARAEMLTLYKAVEAPRPKEPHGKANDPGVRSQTSRPRSSDRNVRATERPK